MKELLNDVQGDDDLEPVKPVNRLCSEIKLFDLCDLDRCSHKSGNFCTDADLLTRFDKVADVEERFAGNLYSADDIEDDDDEDGASFGRGFDDDPVDDADGFDEE